MIENETTLVMILASTDGVWRPMRQLDWAARCGGTVSARRQEFRARGLAWEISAGDEAQRKSGVRLVRRLADKGLVELNSGQGKRLAVRLSDFGDSYARALADLPSVVESHGQLSVILGLETTCRTDRYVRSLGALCFEPWLLGKKNYEKSDDFAVDLCLLQRSLLPGIVRGWVESKSDVAGRVYFQLTAVGRKVASELAPVLPQGLPEPDAEAAGFYDEATVEYRERLRGMRPESSDIGPCPLPCSIDLPRPRRRGRAGAVARPEVSV